MEKEEQQRKLKEWSEETVKFYLEQVEQVNQDGKNTAPSFYNQSDLSRVNKCELMIIGINPGCGSPFSEWKLKDKISSDFLYKGNPCFEGKSDQEIINIMSKIKDEDKKRYGWDLWHKIHSMLNFSGKEKLMEDTPDKFVITNMVFFGTAEEKQIPEGIDQEKCAEKTLELIDILEPKVVLLLGDKCKQLFTKVAKITHMEELVPGYHVFYCFYNNRHIIAIYHTAYYKFYTNHNRAVIGKTIGYALDNSSKRIEKQNLESILSELIKVDKLKEKINANGSIQWIYNQDTLVHEYYTDYNNKTGKFYKSDRRIVIDLCPNYNENEYWIKVFTRENDKSQSEIIAKEALGTEFEGCPDNQERHLYARITMSESNEKIVEIMNDLLQKIKDYRDKKYIK